MMDCNGTCPNVWLGGLRARHFGSNRTQQQILIFFSEEEGMTLLQNSRVCAMILLLDLLEAPCCISI